LAAASAADDASSASCAAEIDVSGARSGDALVFEGVVT